jgi:hypothetical protein
MPLSQEDWKALDDVFQNLDATQLEQPEIVWESEAMSFLGSWEEIGSPA